MKKIIPLIIISLSFINLRAQSRTCFFYTTQIVDIEFQESESDPTYLRKVFSNIDSVKIEGTIPCWNKDSSIKKEYKDAFKIKYPKDYIWGNEIRVKYFDGSSEARKARRSDIARLIADDWEIIYFEFTYYGDD